MRHLYYYIPLIALLVIAAACRQDEEILVPEHIVVTQPELTDITGFYLLNEGNMGMNKCSLDYYDYTTGTYSRDIYGDINPDVVKDLGDVGNDIGIYGERLYCVINCSNKVEVMDRTTARRIGQVNIPNCRYIKFAGGYAYVTSYAGPVMFDYNYKQLGYVAKIDTATLQIVDTCLVGYQPDGLEIVNDKIYVANSGGYLIDQASGENNYETTVSVIDINTFKEEERIEIAQNLHYCLADRRGVLWVSSRGDYYTDFGSLTAYDILHRRVLKRLDCNIGDMWLDGDSLYVVSSVWSYVSGGFGGNAFKIIDTRTMEVVSENFITDGTDARITKPYGVAVNPVTKDIYVTDAKAYVNPGRLFCFGSDGKLRWEVRTGDIPAHFAFVGKNHNEH